MTKTIIVDASAAASWLLASQSTRAAEFFLLDLDSYHLAAPDIFQWEVGNLLLRQARRDPQFDLNLAYQRLDEFQIEVARPLGRRQLRRLSGVAADRGLSLFDASYLWLCLGLDAGLASRDTALLSAASAAGQPIFDLRDQE